MLSTRPTRKRIAMTWFDVVTAARQNVKSYEDLLATDNFASGLSSKDANEWCQTYRPHQFARRDPDAGPDFCKDNLRRDLANDISGSPSNINDVDLIGIHGQIFLHSGDIGVRNVRLIQVLDEVTQRQDNQNAYVQLLYESNFFFGSAGLIVPDVRPPWNRLLRNAVRRYFAGVRIACSW